MLSREILVFNCSQMCRCSNCKTPIIHLCNPFLQLYILTNLWLFQQDAFTFLLSFLRVFPLLPQRHVSPSDNNSLWNDLVITSGPVCTAIAPRQTLRIRTAPHRTEQARDSNLRNQLIFLQYKFPSETNDNKSQSKSTHASKLFSLCCIPWKIHSAFIQCEIQLYFLPCGIVTQSNKQITQQINTRFKIQNPKTESRELQPILSNPFNFCPMRNSVVIPPPSGIVTSCVCPDSQNHKRQTRQTRKLFCILEESVLLCPKRNSIAIPSSTWNCHICVYPHRVCGWIWITDWTGVTVQIKQLSHPPPLLHTRDGGRANNSA